VPVHEGRAVMLGVQAGFYELTAGDQTTSFAASLLDPAESAIAPRDAPAIDGRVAEAPEGFHVGVRREIWIYLLLAAALLTALEWATYHRRVTV
jgi:Ca-activated chloride channel family protein